MKFYQINILNMRTMIRIAQTCLITFILFFSANILLAESTQSHSKNAKEEEKTIPRFFLDYSVVDHSLKNDKGYSMELLELYEKNPNSAIFLAEFWHQKALKECGESIQEIGRFYSKKITLDMTKEEQAKVMEPAKKAADKCFYGFYYDNWDEINKTIVSKLKAEKINYRRNNYGWCLFVVITICLILIFWIKGIRKQKTSITYKGA